MKRNAVDKHLESKLQKALKQTEHSWIVHCDHLNHLNHHVKRNFPNRAVIRYNWNKYQVKEIQKFDRKLSERFIAFMNMATDLDPQFCFVSGRYIPPNKLGIEAIKPFPKGEWCYKESYDSYINHNNVDDRLTEKSMLISIATRPKHPQSYTHRTRIRNNEIDIVQFLQSHIDMPESYNNWKLLRANFFLKPSGKPFPKPRS